MARAGLGAAVLPLRAARACDLTGVSTLSLVEPTVRRSIGFLYRSMAELSPAVKAFMKHAIRSGIR